MRRQGGVSSSRRVAESGTWTRNRGRCSGLVAQEGWLSLAHGQDPRGGGRGGGGLLVQEGWLSLAHGQETGEGVVGLLVQEELLSLAHGARNLGGGGVIVRAEGRVAFTRYSFVYSGFVGCALVNTILGIQHLLIHCIPYTRCILESILRNVWVPPQPSRFAIQHTLYNWYRNSNICKGQRRGG